MNWEEGQIVKVDGRRYRVEHIAYPSGSPDEGLYDVLLQRVGLDPADVPKALVATAGDAVDWVVENQVMREILAAVIPEIAAEQARKILGFCQEHDGDHGENCGYAIAANVIAGRSAF